MKKKLKPPAASLESQELVRQSLYINIKFGIILQISRLIGTRIKTSPTGSVFYFRWNCNSFFKNSDKVMLNMYSVVKIVIVFRYKDGRYYNCKVNVIDVVTNER